MSRASTRTHTVKTIQTTKINPKKRYGSIDDNQGCCCCCGYQFWPMFYGNILHRATNGVVSLTLVTSHFLCKFLFDRRSYLGHQALETIFICLNHMIHNKLENCFIAVSVALRWKGLHIIRDSTLCANH